jgi:hypothetical protein
VVAEWPRVYNNLTLDSECHYSDKPSGGGTIPAYMARNHVDSHTGEPALIVHLYDVPQTAPAPGTRRARKLPVICPRLNINGHTIRTISTVMRFDTAVDVTASELRIELMFPADEESEA